MSRRRRQPALFCFMLCSIFAMLFFLLPACSSNRPQTYQKSRALMDTFITITVAAGSGKEADNALETAFAVIEGFGKRIDFFSGDSELSRINSNAGIAGIRVSADTFDLIEKALYVADRSGGAFDPTIGPVVRLWDFHKKTRPSDTDIKRGLALVGYKQVVLDKQRSTVFLKKKGMLLDLGGIAKGYAADLAAESLKAGGIASGIVAIAGDIRAFGLRPDGTPWNIGIKNPRQERAGDEIIGSIRLSNRAVSTAGDYERYFIEDGRRYHHILDPSTGYPAGQCRSVSIITEKGVFTDGFDNAVFVLGPQKGMQLIREINRDFEMDGIIIDADGSVSETDRIKGTIKNEKSH
ncbi:MAG: FAD:protein FMN transferase [Nitrospirae bacterium]|nr:MAG: FAD:protein FMN transferase [Nitrospirota bacterium]